MRTPVVYTDYGDQWGVSMPSQQFGIAAGAATLDEARHVADSLAKGLTDGEGMDLIEAFAGFVTSPDGIEYRIVVPIGSERRMEAAQHLSHRLESAVDPDLYPRPLRSGRDGVRELVVALGSDTLGWLSGFMGGEESALLVNIDAAADEDGLRFVRCLEFGNHVPIEGGTRMEELGLTLESTLAEAQLAIASREAAGLHMDALVA